MLYQSRKMAEDIISDYDKSFLERTKIDWKFGFENTSLKFELEDKSLAQVLDEILDRQGKMSEDLSEPLQANSFYKISGELLYKGIYKEGLSRRLTDDSLVSKLRENEFLTDDLLQFEILKFGLDTYEKISIICSAVNLNGFGRCEHQGVTVLSADSLGYRLYNDRKSMPIEALILFDELDPAAKAIEGRCVYIKQKHGRFSR